MKYLKLKTIEEASSALKSNLDPKLLSGGTDLLVHRRHERIDPKTLIDLKHIDFLKTIEYKNDFMCIGSAVTLNEIVESKVLDGGFDILKQAAFCIACTQIRNRATIGGNLCNASPAADMIPPLYAMDAIYTIFAKGSYIDIKVQDFYQGPGKTSLPDDGILCYIKIPAKYKNGKGVYYRHSRRKALDLAINSVAAVNLDNKYSIALGSVAPTIIRVSEAESLLNKEGLDDYTIKTAARIASKACSPISDLRASKEYRVEMVKSFTQKALRSLRSS